MGGVGRFWGGSAALQEGHNALALPDADAENDDGEQSNKNNHDEVGADFGADIVRENDDRETTEGDDSHEALDGEIGEAGDITNNVIRETWEKKNREKDERSAFGIDNKVEFVDGGLFE